MNYEPKLTRIWISEIFAPYLCEQFKTEPMNGWYERRPVFTEFLFRIWYRIINKLDRNGEVVFMNFGFWNGMPTNNLNLNPAQESNWTGIQLYDQLVSGINLKDKHILEIGSGRGGGLAFLTNRYKPAMATGIDLDKTAIKFCNKKHGHRRLRFFQGNAEKLQLEDNSVDVVINVESSHRYENMRAFLSEVKRVLRPGGIFLMTDFRYDHHLEKFYRELEASGLRKIAETLITPFIVKALEHDDPRRRELIERLAPWFIRKTALEFAGVVGSKTYRSFDSGRWLYFNYHFIKEY